MRTSPKILSFILVWALSAYTLCAQNNTTLKKDKEFIAIAYYHIFNTNISGNKLDNYLAFINGFGDKELLKNILIKDWAFNIHSGVSDSVKNYLLNTQIVSQPALSDQRNINEVNLLINYFIFNEIQKKENFIFFKDGFEIMQKLSKICPDLCADDIETPDCLQSAVMMTQKALRYPEDVDNLYQYYLNSLPEHGDKQEGHTLYLHLKNKIHADIPMIRYYFGDGTVEDCLKENEKSSIILPLEEIRKNTGEYTAFVYQRLLSRPPTLEEISVWESYYGMPEAVPGMIFYAIITSEDYKYL